MRVIKIEGTEGIVELEGVKRKVNFQVLDNIKTGDYVLVHAGFAIQKVSQKDAEETISLLREMAQS